MNFFSAKTPRSCPGCGASRFERANTPIPLLTCCTCGLLWDPTLWSLHNEDEAAQWQRRWFDVPTLEHPAKARNDTQSSSRSEVWQRGLAAFKERWFDRRAKQFWAALPDTHRRGRLLDVGAGDGALASRCRTWGMQVVACELSLEACARLHEQDIRVFEGTIEAVPHEPNYDVIVARHLLEHQHEPLRWLKEAHARCASGGLLHLAVPNAASWEAQAPYWNAYVPYHLLYFTPESLKNLLVRAGFSVLHCETKASLSAAYLVGLGRLLASLDIPTVAAPAWVRATQRRWLLHGMGMLGAGFLTWPLRYLQKMAGKGDELVVWAMPISRQNEAQT